MAINIKFDLLNNPEPPTLILANRNGNKLGQLEVNPESVELIDKFNEASEISFTVNKYLDDKITNLWDKLVDFKLVYCKEWDCWFEAKVELDEATESVKTVFCTQLGQAELSQIMLYDIEINTEADIERDDYKIGILYDSHDSQCILRRLLDKAPHYSIIHVDDTLWNIQRSFSFDGTSIYDAFQEIAEEIGCLFVFNSDSDENGMPQRTISVYDLQQNCLNSDCKHRGEFTDKCPKCGSIDIKYGYGEDTLIFVTSDELASQGIQLVTDTDSVKNCFKLEAGDDLMTATVRNRNPNGTDYIWYFSDATKEDMPNELVEKIEKYDKDYQHYYKEYESTLDSNLLSKYNTLVDKYSTYYNDDDKDLETISNPIKGFSSLMEAYYNVIDLGWYLKSGLMPTVTMGNTNAEEQGLLLEVSLPPLIAVTSLQTVSKATADSTVLAMAKAIVGSHYKVNIVDNSSALVNGNWSGRFIITNYSDEEDTYTTTSISRALTDWDETYIKQKIDKILSKENTDDLSITGLFEKEYAEFCEELHKYALTPLTSFHDACQACLDILIEQGVGNKSSEGYLTTGSIGSLYNQLYLPYFNKLKAIEAEMKVREIEVNDVINLQENIENIKADIQGRLNFENYLGEDLWLQFCAYRREDKYSNSNYISDGLNNAELFERALQFYEVAENEIFKSAELQHSISATLNNLLAIPKFKALAKSFAVGNWIRVQVNDNVYKLRLVEYEISYKNFDSISVEFSDVAKTKNGYSDLEDILSDASSMASSYDSIQRQANLGNEARDMIRVWLNEGLDASLVQIQNNTNEDIVIDNNGLIGRSYSDITEEYSPEQIRLTHNVIAFTDDNWESVKQAIGKHKYKYFDKGENKFVDNIGYGVSADFVTAGIVSGSQIIGGDIYSDNYSITNETGSYLNLRDGTFIFGGGALRFEIDEESKKGKLMIGSDKADTNITELNDEWLKTTTVFAKDLQVNAAKVNGELTAATISADKLTAGTIDANEVTIKNLTIDALGSISFSDLSDYEDVQNQINNAGGISTDEAKTLITSQLVSSPIISGGTINGAFINGGNLIIGTKIAYDANTGQFTNQNGNPVALPVGGINAYSYAEITSNGVLNCNAANITGSINIYSNNNMYNNELFGSIGYTTGRSDMDVTEGIGLCVGSIIYVDDSIKEVGTVNRCFATSAGAAIESYTASPYGYYRYSKMSTSETNAVIEAVDAPGPNYSRITATPTQVLIETASFQCPTPSITSSDASVKHNIDYNLDKYDSVYNELQPCIYKYNYGTSDRYHTGFIAQDVKAAIENNGLSTNDLAAYVEFSNNSDDKFGKCGLRYEEFIALNTWQIQKLKKKVSSLEEQVSILTEQLNKLNINN